MWSTFLQLPLFSWEWKARRSPRRKAAARTAGRRAVPQASDAQLHALWQKLLGQYFPERIDLKAYQVGWARRRQKRTLGSCNLTRRKVLIARELRPAEYADWVEAVLYHELCHAVLGVDKISYAGRRAWHGKEFRALESRHPSTKPLQSWMKNGGWARAVRSERSRARWQHRRG